MADIAVCSECAGEMDVTAAAPFNRVSCPNCAAEVRVKVDFGSYLLQKRLAFGGMSVLFVARDQTLGREVALKVLNEEYSRDEVRTAQFEKEAELTALVSHPNVVRVYSVGRAFERFYIAMELIAGESLEKRLESGKGLPEKEVLEIGLKVAEGLKAAKASGLIHRDIKPGNILVDEKGETKIVDFGLSLVTQAGSARAQEVFATPYYAPPEALEARVEDFRSDVYALGATLYHALAGRAPIETKSTNTKVLLEAKLKAPPLRKIAPSVSQSTADAVDKMMSYQREARTHSYDEVMLSLRRALKGDEQKGRAEESTRQQRRGNQKGIWVSGLVGVALLVVAVLALQGRGKDEVVGETPDVQPVVSKGPTDAMRVTRIYRKARTSLVEGDFNAAELSFFRLYRQEDVPEPTGTWAGFEAGLCALLDGRAGDARNIFGSLEQRLSSSKLSVETRVSLEGLLENWGELSPYLIDSRTPSNPEVAMMEFAKALKNWEQGERDLVPFFDSFSEMEFTERQDWVKAYQDWAGKISSDMTLLAENEPDWSQRWSVSEIDTEVSRLDQQLKALQTSGRAVFMIKSWKEWLQGVKAGKQKPSWEKGER